MQVEAHGSGGVGVNGAVAAFDVADDAFLIDHNVGAQCPLVGIAALFVILQDAYEVSILWFMSLSRGNLMLISLAKALFAAGLSMLTPKTAVSLITILPESIPDWTAWSCFVQPLVKASM